MKKLFYLGILGLILFEIANVYFIMPLPGSQKSNSIGVAYFLYSYRWIFRTIFCAMIIVGILKSFKHSIVLPIICLIILFLVVYFVNFKMSADHMFLKVKNVAMTSVDKNKVDTSRLVLGINYNGLARAYPIQFLGYHHQVIDTMGGKPVMATYCTVCRTGRVYEPVVNGKQEVFRLVGMDHFNAMFEDETTKSWWRQVTGEAIAGELKGQHLPEIPYTQMSLGKWISLNPNTLIMQADSDFINEYIGMINYEAGKSKSSLTKKDSLSWKDKSWIVGIVSGDKSMAYDWDILKKKRVINSEVGNQPIVIALATDNKSFVAFKRQNAQQIFTLSGDSLYSDTHSYNLLGMANDPAIDNLEKINAYQEYWHSWRTFHPNTKTSTAE